MASLSSEVMSVAAVQNESQVTVRALDQANEAAWDRFVARQGGTFFHLTGWKRAIEKTYGFKSCYQMAMKDGEISAIAPLFSISNWVMGNCLVSLPMAVYGGIVAADGNSGENLRSHLMSMATRQNVEHLELRQRDGGIAEGFHHNPLYVTFGKELLADHDANMKDLPRDTRYMVRKGAKNGLTARHGVEQLDAFYQLFGVSMHRHGTPVFPKAMLKNFIAEFGDHVDLMMVYAGEEPVSGVFSFIHGNAILPYYAGAGPTATKLAANNFMYWELMKWAVDRGLRWFDFGRSKKGTGSYEFKTQWNMKMETLDYQLFLVKRKEVPNFSPLNPKFDRAAKMWQKLPFSLSTWMGPHIVKWFP
jgi:FemAB-related protein (PEP-CTERM system-associated)